MNRRSMLKGLLATGVPAAAAALTVNAASAARESADTSIAKLKARVDSLTKRFEQSDARNRKLLKTAIGLAALSLGIDVSSVL